MQTDINFPHPSIQSEGLACAIRYSSFFFQTTPAGIVAEPQQITVSVCHLARDTDLVDVEVVRLLSAFAVFADVVTGETAFVRTTMLYVEIGGFVQATACYFE